MGNLWGNRRLTQSVEGTTFSRVGDSAPAPAFAPASAPCLDEHMAGVYQGSESELDHLWKPILAMHRPTLHCGTLPRRTPGLRTVVAAASWA